MLFVRGSAAAAVSAAVILMFAVMPVMPAQNYTNLSDIQINPATGEIEILQGNVCVPEIDTPNGIIVKNGAVLIVEGDVNSGGRFVCDGGSVYIHGRLTAERVWIESDGAVFEAEAVECSFFTQLGGTVKISGGLSIIMPLEYDGLGLVNVMTAADAAAEVFSADGNYSVPPEEVWIGDSPCMDEVLRMSFEILRYGEVKEKSHT